jgi:hypothetical protein
MRALLVPQRQLAGELRVLVDARLDLLRPVHQLGLGKVVDHGRAVVRAVAAPGDPSDQVVAVGRREGKNLHELLARLAGQLHQDEVGLHGLRGLLAIAALPVSVATVHRSSRLKKTSGSVMW